MGRIFLPESAPASEVAIVLGARPGPLLDLRLDAAGHLVEHRKVQRLLLTGRRDELDVMSSRAAAWLAPEHVLVDDAAERTIENLRNARDRFGVRRALVISQRFHLPRVLWLADALGLELTGVQADGDTHWRGRVREAFARARAVWDARRSE